jgi:hypothetical protein
MNDIQELHQRLESLERMVSEIRGALLGQLPEGGGLLAECKIRGLRQETMAAKLESLEARQQ